MKNIIEELAAKINTYYTNESIQIDLIDLAKQLGFEVYKAELPNNVSGMVESNNDKKAIYVNKKDISKRQKFTIAHEIGHIILHHKNDSKFKQVDFRKSNTSFDKKEWEANNFAAALLMPKQQAIEVWQKLQDVDDFADYFGVSKSAAAIRLQNLGLI